MKNPKFIICVLVLIFLIIGVLGYQSFNKIQSANAKLSMEVEEAKKPSVQQIILNENTVARNEKIALRVEIEKLETLKQQKLDRINELNEFINNNKDIIKDMYAIPATGL